MNNYNESIPFPFAKLRIHSEDAIWLRKRWSKYIEAKQALVNELNKAHPDVLQENIHRSNILQHKKAICIFMSKIYSKSSRCMLREAFGEDIEEWMHEHGIKIVCSSSSQKQRY